MASQFDGGREDCLGLRYSSLQNHNPPSLRYSLKRGQELVEFAFVFLVLVLFIFGAVDLGRVFYTAIVVSNSAREGARYGIVYGLELDDLTDTLVLSPKLPIEDRGLDIKNAVKREAQGAQITIQDADIDIVCIATLPDTPGDCEQGKPLRVTVTHNFTPFLTWILGQPTLAIRRAVEMMIP